MKTMSVRKPARVGALLIGVLLAAGYALGAFVHQFRSVRNSAPNDFAIVTRISTPADVRIQTAQRVVEQHPNQPESYNLLASAFMQKARETNDFGFNARAEAALGRSLEVAPDNYDALKLRASLLLTHHRFAEALDLAQRLKTIRSDDHDVYGLLTDAQVELGDYPAAIQAAQQMVNLRPDSSSYARVSYLRSLHGDGEGAIEAMTVAVKATGPNNPEGAAWCRVHLGDELMNSGKLTQAELEYDRALLIFPEYPLALAAKARARVRAGDLSGAVELYERAQARAPLPDSAIALGDLYAKLGHMNEAKRQYDLVEFIEQNSAAGGTYSRQLAMLWADHDLNLNQALAIVQRERSVREDVFTCDALAWVLFKNKRLEEAKKSVEEALRLGTRDARIFYHAGMIYDGLGDHRSATKYLKLAFAINPTFDVLQADKARQTLRVNNSLPANRAARSV